MKQAQRIFLLINTCLMAGIWSVTAKADNIALDKSLDAIVRQKNSEIPEILQAKPVPPSLRNDNPAATREINRLNRLNRQLKQQLAQAKTQAEQRESSADSELKKRLEESERQLKQLETLNDEKQRQSALAVSAALKQAELARTAAQQQTEQQLSDSRQKIEQLTQALKQSETKQAAAQALIDQGKKTQETLQQNTEVLTTSLAAKTKEVETLNQKVASQKPVVPKGEKNIRDYAIGVSLGSNMKEVLEQKESLGLGAAKPLVLDGVRDLLNNQLQLPEATITKALKGVETEISRKMTTLKATNEKLGSTWRTAFGKKAGVKSSPMGFLYRLDYAGEEPIGENDIVEIIVKESLIDGTVISDMSQSKTKIAYPLSEHPPLFRAGLSLLKTKGTITMVVPPELAYGDEGAMPEIPPGATMIYQVRITKVTPAGRQ